ncbi:hypothetical protein ASF93_13490, partial [Microbacterium sp. Leaf347]
QQHPAQVGLGLVTMALAVALVWWQRAVLTGSWWALAWSGIAVGVGFQAKMMQAWLIVPGLLVGTLLVAGNGWRRRAGRVGVLGAATLVASLAWMTIVQLVPAGSRPYIDGSTDNNVFAMVFGYNGVDRLLPNSVAGAVGSTTAHVTTLQASLAALFSSDPTAANVSRLKLFLPEYATQIGWLYPAAALGLALALVRWWPRRRRPRRDVERMAFAFTVAVAVWFAASAAVLSFATLPHAAYVAAIGVQLILLTAVGFSLAVHDLRSPRRWRRFTLAALVTLTAVWGCLLAVWGALPVALAIPMVAFAIMGVIASIVLGFRAHDRVLAVPADPSDMMPFRSVVTREFAPEPVPMIRYSPAMNVMLVLAGIALVGGATWWSIQALDANRDGSGGEAYIGARSQIAGVAAAPADPPDDIDRSLPDPAVQDASSGIVGGDDARADSTDGTQQAAVATASWVVSRSATADGASPDDPGDAGDPQDGSDAVATGTNARERFTISAPDLWVASPVSSLAPREMLAEVARRTAQSADPASSIILTDSWAISADIINGTGEDVLTDGGYSGAVPVFTEAELGKMVRDRELQWVVLRPGERKDPVGALTTTGLCHEIRAWGSVTTSAPAQVTSFTLWQCRP